MELVGTVLDPDPPPSLAGWMLPRRQRKSALVAALGLYDLMLGAEGASVVVVATDERQAGIVFGAAGPGCASSPRSWPTPGCRRGPWDAGASTGVDITEGAEVVLAFDGSFSRDATALVVAEVGDVPHLDVAGLGEPPPGRPDYRVPIVAVEDAIREGCRRWHVRQIVAVPLGPVVADPRR